MNNKRKKKQDNMVLIICISCAGFLLLVAIAVLCRMVETKTDTPQVSHKRQKPKRKTVLDRIETQSRMQMLIQKRLRDPDSYEKVSFSLVVDKSRGEGGYTAYLVFRSKNGFGGMKVSKAKMWGNNELAIKNLSIDGVLY